MSAVSVGGKKKLEVKKYGGKNRLEVQKKLEVKKKS